MKHEKSEKIFDAVTDVRDDIVDRAREPEKKRNTWWPAAVAAVVAVAMIGMAVLWPGGNPVTISAYAIVEAKYPEMVPYPDENDYTLPDGELDYDAYYEAYSAWRESRDAMATNADWPTELEGFLTASTGEFLAGAGTENRVYSPANVYMALAMLAELTDGSSRQQILDLLDVESIQSLRSGAAAFWGDCYINDGTAACILANSLWLNEDVEFDQSTMETLADTYYASSYRGKMGSDEFNQALQEWLNEQTGGLLEDQASQMELDPDTILALASTIYFEAKWSSKFLHTRTEEGVFHTAGGDVTCDFMHQSSDTNYYWGDQFSAVSRGFQYAGSMWFILPDEGASVDGLLHDEQVMNFLFNRGEWENKKYLIVNQSIPKFDVSSQFGLEDGLRALGVTDVFDLEASDFTPMTRDTDEICLSQAEHAARVIIDEEGCTAAAFYFMPNTTASAPPDEEVDFVLDRPFLFAITNTRGIPLFIGVVNQPR